MYALSVVKWINIIHYAWKDKNGSQPRFSVKKKTFWHVNFQRYAEKLQQDTFSIARTRLILIFSSLSLYTGVIKYILWL